MTMARPDGTRQRILAHMATLGAPVSSSELARALGIRPHRCRVHLYKLAGRGAVQCTGTVVRRGGVAKLYRVGPAPMRVVEVRDADSYMRDWRRAVTTQFEARKDAERYRFIADRACDVTMCASDTVDDGDETFGPRVQIDADQYPTAAWGSAKKKLDAAIDAAIAKEGK